MSEQLHEHSATAEREPELRPRIYVASLPDYNAGRLHGVWLDADQPLDDLQADVDRMLSTSPEPGAEEWAIHDYESFGPIQLPEYIGLSAVSRLARGLAEFGWAFGHWAAYVGLEAEEVDNFDFTYCGSWDSLQQWLADSAIDDEAQRGIAQLPDWLQPYVSVDYEALARDAAMDAYVVEDSQGVHVFEVTA